MRFLASFLVLFSTSIAHAGGYQLPIQGTRALSQGGALVGSASEKDAFWYNPSLLRGTSVGLGVSFVDLNAEFQRIGENGLPSTIKNEATPLPNPDFGAVYQIDETFTVGFGAYAPWGGQYKYPENGVQRYALVENSQSKMLFLHLAASAKFGDFSIGAGVQNVYSHLRQRIMLSAYTGLFGSAEAPELDVLNEIDLQDPITITANFGASYELGPFVFGASVQLPYAISGEAKMRVRLPSSVFFDPTEVEGDSSHLEVNFPLAVRGGVHFRAHERLSIDAAVGFEGWSVQETIISDPRGQIMLKNVPLIGDYQMTPIVLDRRMRDTVSLHLGADYALAEAFHLRSGVFYEPSSFGDETFSVAVLDDDKVGVSLGFSLELEDLRIDLAGARIFQGTREITTSELKQTNPTNASQATVIGNGTYESSYWAGGLSFVYRL